MVEETYSCEQLPLIAPSLLSADFLHLQDELDSIKSADWIHYDVMDGSFVPNLSFGHPIARQVLKATDKPLDIHLMIDNPDEAIASYIDLHPYMITFHVEAAKHSNRIVQEIKSHDIFAGISINPGTSYWELESIIEDVDMILVMSVNPGFGGQKFIESTVDKIRAISEMARRHHVSPLIEVDGGINISTAGKVFDAGASVLVAGSSVFGANNREEAISSLRQSALFGAPQEV